MHEIERIDDKGGKNFKQHFSTSSELRASESEMTLLGSLSANQVCVTRYYVGRETGYHPTRQSDNPIASVVKFIASAHYNARFYICA